jgi:Fur family ferric uptake transcriptional regulator
VYRTLNKLVDAGLLRRLELGPRMYYEHDYGYPQHDHLYCQQCHKLIEFSSDDLLKLIDAVSREHQFRVLGHRFIITGQCADCRRSRQANRRLELV